MSAHPRSWRWRLVAATGVCTLVASVLGGTVAARAAVPHAAPRPASVAPGSDGRSTPERGADVGSVARVRWTPCTDLPPGSPVLDCATYRVPLDYAHPGAGRVTLALNRLRSTGPRIGSLFLNPGGPGGSGVQVVQALAGTPLLDGLRSFDIVGMDPRGTNASTPVLRCESPTRTAQRMDRALAHPDPRTAATEALENGREYAAGCQRNSGRLLPFMGSEYVARDLDVLRAAVGDDKLTYLGLSYGTYLGAVYADMFPSRVRAVTLDGALDPFGYGDDFLSLLGANYRSSERSVDAFLRWCSAHASKCGFGHGHAAEALDALTSRLDRHPLISTQGGQRKITNGYTILTFLYFQTTGGSGAWADNGAVLRLTAAGTQVISNLDLAGLAATNVVVECTDSAGGTDPRGYRAFAQRSADLARTIGPALAFGPPLNDGANAAVCASWPLDHPPSDWQGDFRAQGSDPVLVVGSVGDPSTPYPGAVALAHTLDHARLLTERSTASSTHTSWAFNACIRAKVDAYLVHLTLPPRGASCPEE